MKRIKAAHGQLATYLAFSISPLSGFAVDIYLPSLPDMATRLHTNEAGIQLTLSIFLTCYGICQLLIGSLLDAWGRYLPKLGALMVFGLASLIIANTSSLQLVYVMRAVQGITIAIVVVSNRATFLDRFTGAQLKHYVSLFSIIWSAAPIIAPFIGGYLQIQFGWQSNFYVLAIYAFILLILELIIGGETLDQFKPFRIKRVLDTYWSMIKTKDFTAGLAILGLAYAVLMVYNMASPFLIERLMHHPATVTGNMALLSGVSLLLGGIIAKVYLAKPFKKKIILAFILQLIAVISLIALTTQIHNLFTLFTYVVILHGLSGFIFNTILSYCLTRFTENAGIASGLTGGGYTIFTAVFSAGLVSIITIQNQAVLGLGYGILIITMLVIFVSIKWKAV